MKRLLAAVSLIILSTNAHAKWEVNCECLEQTPNSANTECVCHVPPQFHPHTICVAPQAVAAHIAHGDSLGATGPCAAPPPTTTTLPEVTTTTLDDNNVTTTTLEEETTTTTSTTTTTTTTCPDVPILKDPAHLGWNRGEFYIHGSIQPPVPTEINGLGVTLQTVEDGVFLATGCPLVVIKPNKLWKCTNAEADVKVKAKKDNTYAFRVLANPSFEEPSTKLITTRVSFTCYGGENTATWLGQLGYYISNRY